MSFFVPRALFAKKEEKCSAKFSMMPAFTEFEEDSLVANGKNAGLDMGLLVLRLVLGGIFIAHGLSKIVGPNAIGVEKFSELLAGMNLTLPSAKLLAYVVISAEIGGGALVALGLFARLGALAIAVVMVVAIVKVHWENGFFLQLEATKPGPLLHGYENCLALLSMALAICLTGAGRIRVPLGGKSRGG